MTTQEPSLVPEMPQEKPSLVDQVVPQFKYSNRVMLKAILDRGDGGVGLVGQKVVVGGWVKSSKEVKKEPETLVQPADEPHLAPSSVDVTCAEMIQTRVPLFRSILRIFGGGGCGPQAHHQPIRDKLEAVLPERPIPSIVYLLVSDGSSVASLQVVVDSSVAPPAMLRPIGTCILAEGIVQQPPQQGKHVIELKVERILHIGISDHDKYPLSKKRLPLEMLRDFSHFRPRTTTVASVTRIRSALTFGSHTFFQNHRFLCVQVPVITTMDTTDRFSESFQVTTLFNTSSKKVHPSSGKDTGGVTLDVVKAAIKEKSDLVDKLKRTESNREALAIALQDLQKTNRLAAQLEAKEKDKTGLPANSDKLNFSDDFFSRKAFLATTGRLHLESHACSLGNVYSFGPTFCANRTPSTKHMAEMWMVEAEMAFSQLEDAMNCADDFFKFLCKWVLDECSEDMKFVSKRIDRTIIDRLRLMTTSSFERMTYMEAVEILQKVPEAKFNSSIPLTVEHLSFLADEIYKKPVIIYNFPKEVRPFFVRLNEDGKTVAAFDMVVPKVGRVISGSQNEERFDMLETRIKELGLPREQFEWYLDLRRHGTAPHSGFSLGIDLMVLFTTGLVDVKDAVPFPRSFGKANN